MREMEPKARFWVEAEVATAKAAVFIASAEADIGRGDYALGAVNSYYGLFHLGLSLLWQMPDSMPEELHQTLIRIRDAGNELPHKGMKHAAIEEFVEGFFLRSDLDLPVLAFRGLFAEAKALREFASYGPRVTYRSAQPFVGPCAIKPRDVQRLVQAAPVAFRQSLTAAWGKTAYDGTLGRIVADGAGQLLNDAQFPFVGWFGSAVLERARQLVRSLNGTAAPDSHRR